MVKYFSLTIVKVVLLMKRVGENNDMATKDYYAIDNFHAHFLF